MKKLMMMVAATIAALCSWGVESISVKDVVNHYPWDGKVDCVVALGGMENWRFYDGVFQLSVEKGGETFRRVVTNELANVDGVYTNTFDCTALFGPGNYPNGGIAVQLVKKMDGVQLWKDGPYFASCNVGASKPEECGYYFWWGDTVGYKRNSEDTGWVSSKDGAAFTFASGNCLTYKKNNATLQSEGWIDANGNLVAAHDAATAHRGAPWRMPTDAEMGNLVDTKYCTRAWTDNWNGTGVKGYVVTGAQTGYTDKSIFLPAAGYGDGSSLNESGICSYDWSSTSTSDNYYCARDLYFYSGDFYRSYRSRYYGFSVRPVREFAE